jgi:hypothetical protein
VKVDLFHRGAVNGALSRRDLLIDGKGVFPDRLRQGKLPDNGGNVRHGVMPMVVFPVMCVLVVMGMLSFVSVMVPGVFLLPVDQYAHMGAGNGPLAVRDRLNRDTQGRQSVHGLQKTLLVRAELVKSAHEHIAGGAHGAVKIQDLHDFASIWLIMLAI